MILCRRHEHSRLSIAEGKTGCFRSTHVRLNDAGVPRGTKRFIAHDFLDCGDGFFEGDGEEYALPGGKTRCFDYLTIVWNVERSDVGYGFVGGCKVAIFGSGNVVLLEKVFGECLKYMLLQVSSIETNATMR